MRHLTIITVSKYYRFHDKNFLGNHKCTASHYMILTKHQLHNDDSTAFQCVIWWPLTSLRPSDAYMRRNLTTIGSDNDLSPGRRQAIIWTNAGILLIGPLGTNFSEISIKILTFSFTKMRLKVSSAKWRPFCLGLNVLSVGQICVGVQHFGWWMTPLIARFMGPTWGPSGADRTQVGPMLAYLGHCWHTFAKEVVKSSISFFIWCLFRNGWVINDTI